MDVYYRDDIKQIVAISNIQFNGMLTADVSKQLQ